VPARSTKPKVEEPKAEEPKAEEPKAEEPKTEEPKTEEPKAFTGDDIKSMALAISRKDRSKQRDIKTKLAEQKV